MIAILTKIFLPSGAFEVKVPLKRKSTETKPVAKSEENEALKISKLSRKPSPIRMTSDSDDSKNKESSQESLSDGMGTFLNFGKEITNIICIQVSHSTFKTSCFIFVTFISKITKQYT